MHLLPRRYIRIPDEFRFRQPIKLARKKSGGHSTLRIPISIVKYRICLLWIYFGADRFRLFSSDKLWRRMSKVPVIGKVPSRIPGTDSTVTLAGP